MLFKRKPVPNFLDVNIDKRCRYYYGERIIQESTNGRILIYYGYVKDDIFGLINPLVISMTKEQIKKQKYGIVEGRIRASYDDGRRIKGTVSGDSLEFESLYTDTTSFIKHSLTFQRREDPTFPNGRWIGNWHYNPEVVRHGGSGIIVLNKIPYPIKLSN